MSRLLSPWKHIDSMELAGSKQELTNPFLTSFFSLRMERKSQCISCYTENLRFWCNSCHTSSFWSFVVLQLLHCADSLWPHGLQHSRFPFPSLSPRVWSNSCPLGQGCHPAISSSGVPFSSCPQSLPASESFPMSQHFAWGGQSTGVSALASFLPKKSQGWSPSEWTVWISLQSKGLARVFSNTTVQKHQFFGTQLASESNSLCHTCLIHDHRKNHSLD